MSLLDTGPQTADIYPEVETTDERGNPIRVPAEVPVAVRCRIQPVSSEDVIAAGQQTTTRYRLSTRDAPLGAWALVVTQGREWDVEGEPRRYRGSAQTRHVVATLVARGEA